MTREERNQMVLEHQNLIGFVIRNYHFYGIADEEDLYQEGYLALISAVENFDKEKGVEFSTYAVKAIRRVLSRYVTNDKMVRIPVKTAGDNHKIEEYLKEYPRSTKEELEANFGMAAMERYQDSLLSILSGDAPIFQEDGNPATLFDFIVDEKQNVERIVLKKDVAKSVRDFYKSLDLGNPEWQKIAEDIFFEDKLPKGECWTNARITNLKQWYVRQLRSFEVLRKFYDFCGFTGTYRYPSEAQDYLFGTEFEEYK